MAKNYPTDYPTLDSARLFHGAQILGGSSAATSDILDVIESQNWTYAHDARGGLVLDLTQHGLGEAVHQGYLSELDTTVNAYVHCVEGYLIGTTEPTNNNAWRVTTEALADTQDGKVKVEWVTSGGSTIDSVENTHAFGSTTRVTTTVSGGALDPAVGYRIKVSLKAGTGSASAYILLFRVSVDPISVPVASLP